jgi:hypothetical protein
MKIKILNLILCVIGCCFFIACEPCDCSKSKTIEYVVVDSDKDHPPPKYNIEKDAFVLSHFSQTPVFTKKDIIGDEIYYTIRFSDCEFSITHHLARPYEYKEYWSYDCIMKDGTMILIETRFDVWKHACSEPVYKFLRNYCLAIKQ